MLRVGLSALIIVFVLFLIRLVQPAFVYRVRAFLARVRVSRALARLEANNLLRPDLYKLLTPAYHRIGAADGIDSFLYRSVQIRKSLALSRREPHGANAHERNLCLVELAAMIEALGRQPLEEGIPNAPIIGADRILFALARERFGSSLDGKSTKEAISMCEKFPANIDQCAEVLIVAIYLLHWARLTNKPIGTPGTGGAP